MMLTEIAMLALILIGQAESLGTNAIDPVPTEGLTYTYNPFGKRDPFRSFLSEKTAEAQIGENPLTSFDLSKFSLTGILWGVANPKAIVKDGNNRGHIISRGTRIGRNKGSVVRILKNEVVVQEEFRDLYGKLSVSEYSMKMESPDDLKRK